MSETPSAAPAAATPAPAATPAATANTAPPAAAAPPPVASPATQQSPTATAGTAKAEVGYWANDWRERMAGGDVKEKARLDRMASPEAVYKSFRAMEQRLSSGELKGPYPKDGKPEAQAAWRKENGVPETAEAYDISLPDGLVVGEADLPIVAEVKKALHEVNAPQAVMTKALTAYYKMRAAEDAAQDDADLDHKAKSEEALRQEWGQEYRVNVNAISNFVRQTFGKDADRLLGARLADGRPLGNDPAILRALANVVRELNPIATVAGHSGTGAAQAVDAEIAALEKRMRDDRANWFKDDAAQARYRQLTEARDKAQQRAA